MKHECQHFLRNHIVAAHAVLRVGLKKREERRRYIIAACQHLAAVEKFFELCPYTDNGEFKCCKEEEQARKGAKMNWKTKVGGVCVGVAGALEASVQLFPLEEYQGWLRFAAVFIGSFGAALLGKRVVDKKKAA